ncbi:hypothetical protein N0O92_05775 [Alkalihalobacillus sp. MEB130]|uniref:hypothetical protein n=1 Tax=Alkalihalobacillus sp. MEB130 TaxID=2976704 RepID=UPI0028DDF928|nr:hypothetical protein [Alkalihalobacillus sp. MEB130]MDT8859735.1 hypothetical protein [Alkalihalobacillus sp. MEB130]
MFDPTIFDNLKVGMENHLYDLDTIEQLIEIKNRKDIMDFSIMSRQFALEFHLANQPSILAEIVLHATIKDLSDEILEVSGQTPGCSLLLRFSLDIVDVKRQCNEIENILLHIWDPALPPNQIIQFPFEKDKISYTNTIELQFNHKINEEHMADIPGLVEHVLLTLQQLQRV